jgi:hypothetical protein
VNLRDWSLWRVLLLGMGWIILVLVIALPRALRFLSGRASDGSGALVGVSFGPKAMLLVLLLAVLPPIALAGLWLWQRSR